MSLKRLVHKSQTHESLFNSVVKFCGPWEIHRSTHSRTLSQKSISPIFLRNCKKIHFQSSPRPTFSIFCILYTYTWVCGVLFWWIILHSRKRTPQKCQRKNVHGTTCTLYVIVVPWLTGVYGICTPSAALCFLSVQVQLTCTCVCREPRVHGIAMYTGGTFDVGLHHRTNMYTCTDVFSHEIRTLFFKILDPPLS